MYAQPSFHIFEIIFHSKDWKINSKNFQAAFEKFEQHMKEVKQRFIGVPHIGSS